MILQGEFEVKTTKSTDTTSRDQVESVPPKQSLPGKNVALFSAFCEFPKNIEFENQEANEKIILVVRRHFITNVPWIALSVVLALL